MLFARDATKLQVPKRPLPGMRQGVVVSRIRCVVAEAWTLRCRPAEREDEAGGGLAHAMHGCFSHA